MSLISLLASNNYIIVNKEIAKILGIEGAVLLGELCAEHMTWQRKDMLQDGYFYSTIENIRENTTLTEHKQRSLLNAMKSKGIVDVAIRGLPAKRYIRINEEVVAELLNNSCENSRTSYAEIEELDAPKSKGNNNNINSNKNNNKNIYSKKPYGEYGRVKLTDSEYNRLIDEYGKDMIDSQITLLDEYVESNNNKNRYTNFNLVLRKSIRENWFRRGEANGKAGDTTELTGYEQFSER